MGFLPRGVCRNVRRLLLWNLVGLVIAGLVVLLATYQFGRPAHPAADGCPGHRHGSTGRGDVRVRTGLARNRASWGTRPGVDSMRMARGHPQEGPATARATALRDRPGARSRDDPRGRCRAGSGDGAACVGQRRLALGTLQRAWPPGSRRHERACASSSAQIPGARVAPRRAPR